MVVDVEATEEPKNRPASHNVTMEDPMTKILLPICCVIAVYGDISRAETQPLIVAHRGLLRHAPENTLANFRACLELRLGFEFDVERTKDGQLVCIHDSTVDRTTNGSGKVSDLTAAQIRKLDAGSWFDRKFAGEPVPTVEDVLKLIGQYRQLDVLIAVDLKANDAGAEVVLLAERHKVLDRLLFIGRTIVEPGLRREIKAASAKAHTAAVANNPGEFTKALNAPRADWVYFRFIPSKEQMEAVHKASKRTFIAGSTVSGHEPKNWTAVAKVGMDSILTDYPLELRQTLRQAAKVSISEKSSKVTDEELAKVQGKWYRNVETKRGKFKIIKDHKGNLTTLTVLDANSRIVEEKQSEFRLEITDKVRVFTFFNNVFTSGPNKGRIEDEAKSYIYRISDHTFVEIRGMLVNVDEPAGAFTWRRLEE